MSAYRKCQLVGWSFYGLLATGIPTLYGGMRWTVALRAALGIALGLFLTEQLRRYMRRHGWVRLPLRRLAARVAVASVTIAGLMVALLLPLLLVNVTAERPAGPLVTIFSIHLVFVLAWISLYLGYHYLHRVHTAEAERWRTELTMRETELRALRAQLDPHFLFNSLNSLRALIPEDPTRAQAAVTGLAALLRYTLQLSRARTTTLENELEITRHYLELEALRFESRLRYTIAVDPGVLRHAVPPMLLQTLVENALKHGIAHRPEGGFVDIAVRDVGGGLHIIVRNSGTLRPGSAGGIGLANARERLRLIFGDDVSFELRQTGTNEVTCSVVVPRDATASPRPAGARQPMAAVR